MRALLWRHYGAAVICPSFTLEQRKTFLQKLSETGLQVRACEEVGVNRRVVYSLRKDDKEFEHNYETAMIVYRERLEEEIHRRGMEGWQEPVFYRGEVIGAIRKFDSNLLMFHAKRHIPEYREKQQVDLTLSGGVLLVHAAHPTAADWEKHARAVESQRPQLPGPNGNGNGNGGG